ncbi:hypothetical protein BASA84_001402 [Batrachochytrium salamandrivorans]|nr:hypothetical protein BASA84_001402 [Batrachochytrium salamandrivorans]
MSTPIKKQHSSSPVPTTVATPGESGQLPDYLAASFDPARATIIQLVRILSKHSVELPTSRQPKSCYVALFHDHIASNRHVLLAQRAKPTPKPPRRSIFYEPPSTPTAVAASDTTTSTTDTAASHGTTPPNTTADGKKRRRPTATLAATADPLSALRQVRTGGVTTAPIAGVTSTPPRIVEMDDNPFQVRTAEDDSEISLADRLPSNQLPVRNAISTSPEQISASTSHQGQNINVFSDDNPFQSPSRSTPLSPNAKMLKTHQTTLRRQLQTIDPAGFDASSIRFVNPSESSPLAFSFKAQQPSTSPTSSGSPSPVKSTSRGSRKKKPLSKASLKGAVAASPTPASATATVHQSQDLGITPSEPQIRQRQAATTVSDMLDDQSTTGSETVASGRDNSNPLSSNTKESRKSKSSPRSGQSHRRGGYFQNDNVVFRRIVGLLFFIATTYCIFRCVDTLMSIKWTLPYCEHDSATLGASNTNQQKTCAPCPDRALCVSNTDIECKADYILELSPWSSILGNQTRRASIIGRPRCVQDFKRLEKEARIHQRSTALVNILDELVREWVGKAECGQVKPSSDIYWAWSSTLSKQQQRVVLGMPLALARQHLRAVVPKSWTDNSFDEHWQIVSAMITTPNPIGPLSTRLDDSTYQHRLLISLNPPLITLTCQVRRYIWGLVLAYSLHLTLVCGAVIAATLMYSFFQQYLHEQRLVSILVDDILDMTRSKGHGGSTSNGAGNSSFIMSHGPSLPYTTYKDPLGRTIWAIPDASTRKRLWSLVVAEILKTSTIRKTTMEVKGQPQDLWMWVASPALSPRKPRSAYQSPVGPFSTPLS